MQHFHDATTITLKKYYSEPHFIDWTTQPRSYKGYPHFYRRFNLTDYEELAFIQNMGKITFEKTYYNQTIALRTVPVQEDCTRVKYTYKFEVLKTFYQGFIIMSLYQTL